MLYQCHCGNISEKSYNAFTKRSGCIKCTGSEKFTYEYVKQYFQDNGCILLSTNYENSGRHLLDYKCKCGEISKINFANFKNEHRCRKCRTYYIKYTINDVKEYLKKFNYTLLEDTYVNFETKMKYECNKKHKSYMSFHSFYSGYRCPYCINKTEGILKKYLEHVYKNVNYQAKFEWCKNIQKLPFDFLLPDYKIIIEMDGEQHFRHIRKNFKTPEEQTNRDVYKTICAINNGYKFIRIFQEDVYKNTINWKYLLNNCIMYSLNNIDYISSNPDLYNNHKSSYQSAKFSIDANIEKQLREKDEEECLACGS